MKNPFSGTAGEQSSANDSVEADETPAQRELTADEAAAHVRREVPVIKKGEPTGETRLVAVETAEVFAHSLRDGLVTVVTVDGQKFTADLDENLIESAAS